MARWPRHVWTSIYTYAVIFLLFPLLCLLAYAWVRGPFLNDFSKFRWVRPDVRSFAGSAQIGRT